MLFSIVWPPDELKETGQTNIDWQRHAFGAQKSRRKTVGFGKYDKRSRTWSDLEMYVLDLPLFSTNWGRR